MNKTIVIGLSVLLCLYLTFGIVAYPMWKPCIEMINSYNGDNYGTWCPGDPEPME
jgi:hypothetical protein